MRRNAKRTNKGNIRVTVTVDELSRLDTLLSRTSDDPDELYDDFWTLIQNIGHGDL